MKDHYSDALRADETAMARRLVDLFNHPLREQRQRALAQLVELGEAAVPALLDALRHEEGRTREGALRGLMQIASPRSIEALMDYVDAHEAEIGDNRAFAMQALAAACSPHVEGFDRLFRWLTRKVQDRSTWVRAYAFVALGRLGDARVRPVVERGLKDKEPFVAERAAEALGRLDAAPAREAAPQRRLSPEEIGFGLQATDAPTREMALNDLVARVREERFDALPLLTGLLHGPNFIGRRSALHALGVLRETRALRSLVRLLEPSAAEADLQAHALRAIEAMTPALDRAAEAQTLEQLKGYLRHLVRHKDLFVRSAAVAALIAVPDGEALELLILAAGDKEAWIQEEASAALLRYPADALRSSAAELSRVVTRTLEHAHSQRGRDGAWPAEARKQLEVAERLLSALIGAIPERPSGDYAAAAIPAGWAALHAGSARLRVKGLELLSGLARAGNTITTRHRDDLAELAGALTATQREVLVMALDVLRTALPLRDPVATTSLVSVLHRGDMELALAVIPLLGRAGDPESRTVLQELTRNGNARIAERARAELERLGQA